MRNYHLKITLGVFGEFGPIFASKRLVPNDSFFSLISANCFEIQQHEKCHPCNILLQFGNRRSKQFDHHFANIFYLRLYLISKKFKLELTTLRKDLETDGRHAEVEYIDNWQLDSERRDFTINAIYLDINGNIFDPQNGKNDLKNKIVKFIGDPQKRIEEDYLRIIRFIRFKIMYDFKLEPTTCKAIKLNLNGVKKISKERILVELYKILNFTVEQDARIINPNVIAKSQTRRNSDRAKPHLNGNLNCGRPLVRGKFNSLKLRTFLNTEAMLSGAGRSYSITQHPSASGVTNSARKEGNHPPKLPLGRN